MNENKPNETEARELWVDAVLEARAAEGHQSFKRAMVGGEVKVSLDVPTYREEVRDSIRADLAAEEAWDKVSDARQVYQEAKKPAGK